MEPRHPAIGGRAGPAARGESTNVERGDKPNRVRVEFSGLPGMVGMAPVLSPWMTVDQAMIDAFADVTKDRNWPHIDRERARAELGSTIAHGFLTLSLLVALADSAIEQVVGGGLNYGLDQVRFSDLVPAGSRIRLALSLLSADPRSGGLLLRWAVRVARENARKPALTCEWLTLVYE